MTTVSKFLARVALGFKKFSQPPFDNLWKAQYLLHDFIEFSEVYIFIFTSGSHCSSSIYIRIHASNTLLYSWLPLEKRIHFYSGFCLFVFLFFYWVVLLYLVKMHLYSENRKQWKWAFQNIKYFSQIFHLSLSLKNG